jgi:DNA-binding CsgD family transcriptional regulator
MFEAEIRAISLFFFFALLDDERAVLAATKSTDLFFKKMRSSPAMNKNVAVVSITKQIWEKIRGNFFRGHPNLSSQSGWQPPTGSDLSPWKEFQKSVAEEELLALIWSRILKIKESEISEALGITEGTVRYRVGRGLRKLGGMTPSAIRKIEPVKSP